MVTTISGGLKEAQFDYDDILDPGYSEISGGPKKCGKLTWTSTNSSAWSPWQLLAVIVRAFTCAEIEKKSKTQDYGWENKILSVYAEFYDVGVLNLDLHEYLKRYTFYSYLYYQDFHKSIKEYIQDNIY